jgi:ribosomal protein L29
MADKKQKLKTVEELRTLDEQALTSKLAELKQQLVEQHRAHAAQELPSAHVIGKTRKEIAQILTLLGEAKRQPAQKKEEDK